MNPERFVDVMRHMVVAGPQFVPTDDDIDVALAYALHNDEARNTVEYQRNYNSWREFEHKLNRYSRGRLTLDKSKRGSK